MTLALLIAFASLISLSAAQASTCAIAADYHAQERPDPDGVPTVVKVGIFVADITKIDDVGQKIEGDFVLRKEWRDLRLASLAGCRLQRAQVWFPITDVLNSNQLDRIRGRFAADQVRIGDGGTVVYFQRFFGTVATYHHLRDFPFDDHTIRIRMAPLGYPDSEVLLEVDQNFVALAETLNIPDWEIPGIRTELVKTESELFDDSFSTLHLYISADRNTGYYIWKVIFPLILIVLISFTVFWVNPQRYGPQIGLSATAMLTLIAFQFALTSVLPKVSYFTVMDEIILGSTVLVFGSIVVATVTSALASQQRVELALQIQHICRWAFPATLILLLGVIVVIQQG